MPHAIDRTIAIAMARQYIRMNPDHPDQLLDFDELQSVLGPEHLLDALPHKGAHPGLHTAQLRRAGDLALALLGEDPPPMPEPFRVDNAVYITLNVYGIAAGAPRISVDYGHDMLALMYCAAHAPTLIRYRLTDYPELAASGLVRGPRNQGGRVTEVTLADLEINEPLSQVMTAECHLRWI